MNEKNGDSAALLTRRDLLGRTARGVAALSVSPWLSRADFMLPTGDVAPRTRDTFDFDWRFTLGDPAGARQPDFADASWRAVDLPHDWSIEGPTRRTSRQRGPAAICPPASAGIASASRSRRAIATASSLWSSTASTRTARSGSTAIRSALRPYGFVPFAYELTPYLRFGAENVVAVRVDNSRQTNCRWYSGSGINRHTWLLKTDPLRVAYWGTFVTCPQVGADHAAVRVETTVANGRDRATSCTLVSTLLDASGGVAATDKTPLDSHPASRSDSCRS